MTLWLLPLMVVGLRPDNPSSDDLFVFAPADVVEAHDSTGGDFRVHYTRAGDNAVPSLDADSSGVPDFVEEVADVYDEVGDFYHDTLGFDRPLNDAALTDDGGDGRFDVYLVDFAFQADGAFRIDSCPSSACIGYMVQENDFAGYGYPSTSVAIRILASHEYFHAVQAAYHGAQGTVVGEGTAVWATEQFDPTLNDFEGFLPGYLENVDRSLDQKLPGPVDPFSYGSALFFQFLTEHVGEDTVLNLWQRCRDDDEDWFALLPSLLADYGATYAQTFVDFATWNLFLQNYADSERSYANGSSYPRVAYQDASEVLVDDHMRVFYSSTQYFRMMKGDRSEMTARLVGDAEDLRDLTVLTAPLANGNLGEVAATAANDEPVVRTTADAVALWVAVVNSSQSGDSRRPALCVGSPAEVESCAQDLLGTTNDESPSADDVETSSGCSANAGGSGFSLALCVFLLGRVAARARHLRGFCSA